MGDHYSSSEGVLTTSACFLWTLGQDRLYRIVRSRHHNAGIIAASDIVRGVHSNTLHRLHDGFKVGQETVHHEFKGSIEQER